ncbi:MAG: hypothetical protein V1909_00640, partial [Candidatus Micrarchaeota archaeon]
GINKHLERILGAIPDGREAEFAFENAQDLKIALGETAELREMGDSIDSEMASLKKRAEISRETARLALNQLAELRGSDSEVKSEMETLKGYLSDSEKALTEGRLADSVALSTHIQKRVVYILKPKKTQEDSTTLLVGAVFILLLAAIAAIFLLRSRKQKPPAAQKHVPRAEKKVP